MPSPCESCLSTDSFVVDDAKIIEIMHRVHEEHEYIVCPHTAIGAAYHYQRYELLLNFIIVSCSVPVDYAK